jgi:hypothetical protein
MLKESERKYSEVQRSNEELQAQMRDLKKTLLDKEGEMKQMKQQHALSVEVKERLDKAYGEFQASIYFCNGRKPTPDQAFGRYRRQSPRIKFPAPAIATQGFIPRRIEQ